MSPLKLLARDIGVNDRTLRRAVAQGTLRGTRLSPRRLEMPLSEHQYVRRSWGMISTLRSALRTEPNVRFALLFGSSALGTDTPDSDVDLLIVLQEPDLRRQLDLKNKLTGLIGRPVDLVVLDDAKREPSFLAHVVSQGRVLVDRDGCWPALRARAIRRSRRRATLEAERIAYTRSRGSRGRVRAQSARGPEHALRDVRQAPLGRIDAGAASRARRG